MKNMFSMTLDYTTSYRALLYAQELVRGSAKDGYERLPSYLEQISLANPGSITGLELDSLNRFKYLFLSFGASIRGFQYQRPVIVVDGTHLSGKYEGVMLIAAAPHKMVIFRYFHWLLRSLMVKMMNLGSGFSQNWRVVYLMSILW